MHTRRIDVGKQCLTGEILTILLWARTVAVNVSVTEHTLCNGCSPRAHIHRSDATGAGMAVDNHLAAPGPAGANQWPHEAA